jgi:hypothetical protein
MATVAGGLVEIIGSYGPFSLIKITSPGTTSVAVRVPGMNKIDGAIVQVLTSGNNVATSDADVTWSGDTLTIADGSSFSLADTQTIYALVWGRSMA